MSESFVREDTYGALYVRVETFWIVCREALGLTFDSGMNWTCQEVETLIDLLTGFADDDEIDTLRRTHAALSDTRNGGDCDCSDLHHQMWVDEWGTCGECGAERREEDDV